VNDHIASFSEGGMAEWLVHFWQANSNAVLISLGTGFIFFVLGPIGVWFSGRRIRTERRRRASQALLDLLEDMLVSGEQIHPTNLSALFRAMERETDVVLEGFYDAETLFEDLALRFAKSRHLDATQKNKYSDEIHRISQEIAASARVLPEKSGERSIPRAYTKMFEELRQAINNTDTQKASTLVSELEKRLAGNSANQDFIRFILSRYGVFFKEHPVAATITILLLVIVYILMFVYVIEPALTPTLVT